jgi:hypothetical protein
MPSNMGMAATKYAHFWIGGRADIVQAQAPMPTPKENARIVTIDGGGIVGVLEVNADDPSRTFLDARRGVR